MQADHEKDDLQNLPARAAAFIRLVIRQMGYRKKVRQDVQTELAAHFEDGLKDCKTDQEREQHAQQLIADFGDAKLLGNLLRRAKKRCRPLWKKAIVRGLQTLVVLIVLFCLYTVWFVTGEPTIQVDYAAKLNQLSRPELLDEDNAWPNYEKAIQSYVDPPRALGRLPFRWRKELSARPSFSDLGAEQQEVILQWIQENEKAWDELSKEHRQLLRTCFEKGLVPYPAVSENEIRTTRAYRRESPREYRTLRLAFAYPDGRYDPLGAAVAHILYEIKWQPGAKDRAVSSIKQLLWEGKFLPYRHDEYHIEFDPNDALDAKLINWFEARPGQERAAIQKGIEVGALKYWAQKPAPTADNLFAYLYPFERDLILKWIQDNDTAWRQFQLGSAKSYCYRKYESAETYGYSLPPLNDLRNLARLGIWQARMDIGQGRIQQGLQNCVAVARAGSHWQGRGTLVEQLVGFSMGGLAHRDILDIVQTQELSADALGQLCRQLQEIYPQGYPLMDVKAERLVFLDMVQRVFTDDGIGGGHLVPKDWASLMDYMYTGPGYEEFQLVLYTAAAMVHARRDETVAKFNEIFDKATENAELTPYQRHARNVDDADDMMSAFPKYRYSLIHLFLPALNRVFEISYRAKALHEATVTILALHRWRLENNEYPARLNGLISVGYLKALPMGPYGDGPLNYKKTEHDFILYSVGQNFVDDGGKPGTNRRGRPAKYGGEDGDWILWPLPEAKANQ